MGRIDRRYLDTDARLGHRPHMPLTRHSFGAPLRTCGALHLILDEALLRLIGQQKLCEHRGREARPRVRVSRGPRINSARG